MKMQQWKIVLILATCFLGVFCAIPNFFTKETLKTLPFLPQKQLVLGLDLQGGTQLLMEVDLKGALHDRMALEVDEIRRVLRKEKIGYLNLKVETKEDQSFISLNARDEIHVESIKTILSKMDPNLEFDIHQTHFKLNYTPAYVQSLKEAIIERSIGIISRRIDEDGTKEPTIQRQGEDRILIQIPGVSNSTEVKEILSRSAKLTFHLVDDKASMDDALKGKVPVGSDLLYEERGGTPVPVLVKKQISLDGQNLSFASVGRDKNGNPSVDLKFDTIGASKFGVITKENVGKRFAIVLDQRVLSAPSINEYIPSGACMISGSFTIDEASKVALLMRSGSLPATLTLLSESSVGPDLGADSIYAGKKATLIAIAFVAVFMLFAYAFFGIIANIALVFNIIFLIAGLTLLQATLTLPGIAGIALTIGMAVDANVLIFERIKEELRYGRKPLTAIDLGYNRAMATIVDSNVTTLFGAALLYYFATGPVKGFAVTLALGILISMFTAVSLTRMITLAWYKLAKPKTLSI